MSSYEERKARATKIFVADESDSDWLAGVNEYSERDQHKGHRTEHYETLADNPVEVTVWYWCHDCNTDFWYASTEIVEK